MTNPKKPAWYVATVILKCQINGQPKLPGEWTCIQSIYVLRAVSADDAYEQALQLGKEKETSYLNSDGGIVDWEFVGLENVEELSQKTITRNTEVWGRVFASNDPTRLTVTKEGCSIYYDETVKDIPASELLEDEPETRLLCNRLPYGRQE